MTLWPRGYMRSRDKSKAKYLLSCKTYGHQMWQGGELSWGKLTHSARWPSDNVITWGHVTDWKFNIASSARCMTRKHGRLVTYDERNSPMESHGPPTTWWCVVTWQIIDAKYHLLQGLWSWNSASWWLMVRWTHPWSHMSLWPPGHLRSRNKLKMKCFFLQKTYGHQNLQGADIWWGKAHNGVARLWSRNHKISCVKLNLTISSSARPIPPDLRGIIWW